MMIKGAPVISHVVRRVNELLIHQMHPLMT